MIITCNRRLYSCVHVVPTPSSQAIFFLFSLFSFSQTCQVCPISGKPLTVDDLTPDTELRKKIMRRHIATSMGKDNTKGGEGAGKTSVMADDLYDF